MENEINYSEFIERYLDKEMGESELTWFEKELDDNPELQKELELRMNINKAVNEKDIMELRDQLKEAFSPSEPVSPHRKPILSVFMNKYLGLATVVSIIVAGSLLLLLFMNKSLTNEEIYATYYHPYEASLNFRAGSVNVDQDLRHAMQYYENKDFRNALILFEKILKDDNSRIGLNLYSGISHMEVREYNNANKKFQTIIDHKYNLYIEQAEWYLGFCYLMTDKNDKAAIQFRKIAENGGYYSAKAEEILNRMKY